MVKEADGEDRENEPATRTWRREKPAAREEGSEMDSKGKAEKGGVRIVHMRCFPLHTPVFIGISIRSFQGIEWELQLRSMKQKENTTRVLNWPEWARIREWAKPAATSTPFTSSFSLRCNAFPSSSLPLPSPLSSAPARARGGIGGDLQPLLPHCPSAEVRQCVPLLPLLPPRTMRPSPRVYAAVLVHSESVCVSCRHLHHPSCHPLHFPQLVAE